MSRWVLVILGIGLATRTTLAQSFVAIDQHARTVASGPDSELPGLVNALIKPARTEVEKARVLFVWTATHIQYDRTGVAPYQYGLVANRVDTMALATGIVRRKRGTCTDFSMVLYQLLRLAGLPARVVTGYAKGHPDQAGVPVRGINHQWNQVQIDGCWYPLDATWASTNMNTRPLNLHYFLTPPHQFIADHIPDNPAFQLTESVLTKTQFDAFPRVYDNYFKLGFGPGFPQQGLFQIRKYLELPVPVRRAMEFLIVAHRYEQPANNRTFYCKAIRNDSGYNLIMQVLRNGVYSVHILARPKGDAGEYQPILTLTAIKG